MKKVLYANRLKQYIFHTLGSVLMFFSLYFLLTEDLFGASIVFLLFGVAVFIPDILYFLGIRLNSPYACFTDDNLCISSFSYFFKNEINIKTRNVDRVIEWGEQGNRNFEFIHQDGRKDVINLKNHLGMAFSIEHENDFLSLLKDIFGDVEHEFRTL